MFCFNVFIHIITKQIVTSTNNVSRFFVLGLNYTIAINIIIREI